MTFRKCIVLGAATLSLAFASTSAQAQTTYNEIRSGGFGTSTLPPDAQEWYFDSFGAGSYKWDLRGRVIGNAAITQAFVDPSTPTSLTTINMALWSSGDADLFQIEIVDPNAFTATIASTTSILALFGADGTALAASRGGGAGNAIVGAGLGLSPGLYYIGESTASGVFGATTFGVPRNNANLALFDFTTDGVKLPVAQADMKLATDPQIAWTVTSGPTLLGPGSFTAGGSTITLTGSDFVATPEPGSIAALALVGAALARRRRNV